MSSSTDSLKKKVCVTVFLDELFEEVLEEDWRDLKQVSEITASKVKLTQKPYKGPSRNTLDSEEKVEVSPKADTEQPQVLLRPRKHRRESKFSKNRYDSFKKELSKYGYASAIKLANECCEPESAVSDSDFDLDEFLELDKWAGENGKSSCTELSEVEESFLSINPVATPRSNEGGEKLDENVHSSALSCNKSTQFDGADPGGEKSAEGIEDDEKERQKTPENAGKKTEREVQLILPESRHPEKETCEGDHILRSVLEERPEKQGSEESNVSLADVHVVHPNTSNELSESYTCVFPHNKLNSVTEVKRVWSNSKRCFRNDGFESDFSEADCPHFTEGIDLHSIQNDSLLCYALCLKCQEGIHRKKRKRENAGEEVQSAAESDSTRWPSSLESIKSKESHETDIVFRAVTHLANKAVLGTIVKAEDAETKNEGDIPVEIYERLPVTEGRNKNFAEGDTIEKDLTQEPKFLLDFEAKEKILLCNEMFLKSGDEANIIHSKIIVNRAEIKLDAEENEKGGMECALPPSSSDPEGPAEVLFEQNQAEYTAKNMTDAESEMVFAESENSCENEVFFGDRYLEGPVPSFGAPRGESPRREICVVEFEDELSHSKILRRMKTVEILGQDSVREMKNISTEVILICENISDNEVCLEAWQSSASTLRSITEMGQCYLKDSNDSAMYLIEIPLHFTSADKGKLSRSERFFKASDSD